MVSTSTNFPYLFFFFFANLFPFWAPTSALSFSVRLCVRGFNVVGLFLLVSSNHLVREFLRNAILTKPNNPNNAKKPNKAKIPYFMLVLASFMTLVPSLIILSKLSAFVNVSTTNEFKGKTNNGALLSSVHSPRLLRSLL